MLRGAKAGSRLACLSHHWRRIKQETGLHDVRVHDLRHSYASRALAQGEGLPAIGRLLGHVRVSTTAKYAHLVRDAEKTVAARTGDSIGAQIVPGRAVAALKVERDTVYWDRDLPGFGVRVYPAGGKVCIAQAREPDKTTRRVTVGRHDVLIVEFHQKLSDRPVTANKCVKVLSRMYRLGAGRRAARFPETRTLMRQPEYRKLRIRRR